MSRFCSVTSEKRRWRWLPRYKREFLYSDLHGVIYQNSIILIAIALGISSIARNISVTAVADYGLKDPQ
jgi:hypothetical protein